MTQDQSFQENGDDLDEVGYWLRPEKATSDSEAPWADEELGAAVAKMGETIVDHIYDIDSRIYEYREGLRLLQPMGTGRIDIRFWHKSKVTGRHPVVFKWVGLAASAKLPQKGVKWKKERGNGTTHPNQRVYQAKVLPQKNLVKRLKQSGQFRENQAELKFILGEVDNLLKMRASILETLRRFRIGLTKALTEQVPKLIETQNICRQRRPIWVQESERRFEVHKKRQAMRVQLRVKEEARLARSGFQFVEPKKPAGSA